MVLRLPPVASGLAPRKDIRSETALKTKQDLAQPVATNMSAAASSSQGFIVVRSVEIGATQVPFVSRQQERRGLTHALVPGVPAESAVQLLENGAVLPIGDGFGEEGEDVSSRTTVLQRGSDSMAMVPAHSRNAALTDPNASVQIVKA